MTPKSPDRPLAAVALLLLAVAMAVAAPILPAARRVPDTLRSLAALDRVALQIVPLPAPLVKMGMTHGKIEKSWRDKLKRAGIEITRERGAPALLLGVSYEVDDQVPDAVAALATLFFKQKTRIPRLGRDLHLPTYTMTTHVLARKGAMEEKFHKKVDEMMDDLLVKIREATQAEKR
jgi:hypothetical protein